MYDTIIYNMLLLKPHVLLIYIDLSRWLAELTADVCGYWLRVLAGPQSFPCLYTHQTASSRASVLFFPRISLSSTSADTIERINKVRSC